MAKNAKISQKVAITPPLIAGGFKPYSEYKATGLTWLPQVPAGWRVERGKFLYEKAARPVRECDEVVTCFRDGQVTLRKNRRLEGFTESLKECGYQGVRKGDLVIHVMDAFAGSVGVSDSDGKSTPVYSVCIPRRDEVNNYYFAHVVRVMAQTGYIQSLYRGIRERSSDFRFDVFAAQFLPVPSPDEQRRIVAYLDEKTAKIDRLIQLKEREIELLNEKKQAMIVDILRRTVAGANTIPFGQTMRLKSVCGFADLPLLSVYLNLGVVRFDDIDEKRTNVTSLDVSKYQRVDPGDFVLNNQQAWRGSVGVSSLIGIISPAYVIATLYPMWDIAYANCYLRSRLMVDRYVVCSKGIGSIQRNLDWDALKQERVPMPSLKLQKEAVAKIAMATAKIDAAVAAIEKGIGLLKERRTRLVSDAVTGRIDLRKEVA